MVIIMKTNTPGERQHGLSKTLGLAAMISLGLAISGCGKKTETTKPAVNEKEHTPSWLFVVQAESGKITQLIEKKADNTEQAKKKYTLTLSHTTKDHVIAFTDRPDGIVKYESAKKLEGDWSKGNDSFKKNPPNTVLSSAGIKHPVIVALDSMKTEGDKTTFTLHSAKDNPTDDILSKLVQKKKLNNVVVTIDNAYIPCSLTLFISAALKSACEIASAFSESVKSGEVELGKQAAEEMVTQGLEML